MKPKGATHQEFIEANKTLNIDTPSELSVLPYRLYIIHTEFQEEW